MKRVVIVLLFFIMITVATTVGIRAKYRTVVEMDQTVQFEAELAESVTLTEHEIEKNQDGSYSLTGKINATGENEYLVMPGVDLPKDPTFTITNKSNIPVYLYVEVVESTAFPDTITYSLLSDWKELSISGPHGGKVYLYGNELPVSGDIQVLENNLLKVSQNYHKTEFELDFYGYMAQRIDGKTQAGIFTTCFMSAP